MVRHAAAQCNVITVNSYWTAQDIAFPSYWTHVQSHPHRHTCNASFPSDFCMCQEINCTGLTVAMRYHERHVLLCQWYGHVYSYMKIRRPINQLLSVGHHLVHQLDIHSYQPISIVYHRISAKAAQSDIFGCLNRWYIMDLKIKHLSIIVWTIEYPSFTVAYP